MVLPQVIQQRKLPLQIFQFRPHGVVFASTANIEEGGGRFQARMVGGRRNLFSIATAVEIAESRPASSGRADTGQPKESLRVRTTYLPAPTSSAEKETASPAAREATYRRRPVDMREQAAIVPSGPIFLLNPSLGTSGRPSRQPGRDRDL